MAKDSGQILDISTYLQENIISLEPYIYCANDSTGEICYDDIKQQSNRSRFANLLPRFNDPLVSAHWLRITVSNPYSTEIERLVNFTNPLVEGPSKYGKMEITGLLIPRTTSTYPTHLPVRTISFKPGTHDYFFKIQNLRISGYQGFSKFDQKLIEPTYFQKYYQNTSWVTAMVCGMMIALCLVYTIIFVFNRDEFNLTYASYTLAVLLFFAQHMGILLQVFFSNFPEFHYGILEKGIDIFFLFNLALLCSNYFDTRKHLPVGHNLLWFVSLGSILIITIFAVIGLTQDAPLALYQKSSEIKKYIFFTNIATISLVAILCTPHNVKRGISFLFPFSFIAVTLLINYVIKIPIQSFSQIIIAITVHQLFIALSVADGIYQLNLKNQKAERSLQQKKVDADRQSALDSMKNEFFENISHEFKSPLTLIKAPATKLIQEPISDSQRKEIQTILRNSEKLEQMIEQILDLTKIDVDGLHIKKSFSDLILHLKEVAYTLEPIFKQARIKFTFQSDYSSLSYAFDKSQIEKSVLNLLSNAIKHSSSGGEIELNVTKSQEWISISVMDNGEGITDDDLGEIFNRYRQGRNRRGGNGIGLAISKAFVEMHNGKLEVQSDLGKGSTFTIKLPIDQLFVGNEELLHEEISIPETKNTSESPTPILQNLEEELPIIFVVEDNEQIANYIASSFSDLYRFVIANDSETAYTAIKDVLPDLVITDLILPGRSGFSLIKDLKRDILTNQIPIILLTAKTGAKTRVESLAAGADAFVSKPFELSELNAQIENQLKLKAKLSQRHFSVDSSTRNTRNLKKDHAFLNRVLRFIKEHLNHVNLSGEMIASEMGLSERQLRRKLVALTSFSTTQLIKNVRLESAYTLLKERQLTIAEVGYMVGINSPAYFSKIFKEKYGITPREVLLSQA